MNVDASFELDGSKAVGLASHPRSHRKKLFRATHIFLNGDL